MFLSSFALATTTAESISLRPAPARGVDCGVDGKLDMVQIISVWRPMLALAAAPSLVRSLAQSSRIARIG
jgi:hypothetical protein